MAASRERQKANLSRIKGIMEEIENKTNDSALIAELNTLLKKPYPLSLRWHTIVFKSEVDRSLWYLEDVRKEEIEIEKMKRRLRKEPEEGLKQVYYNFSEIPKEFRFDYHMVYDSRKNQYKWIRSNITRSRRANVFQIPKSMIGDGKLQWSEEIRQKWGEDNIGQSELLEKTIRI